MITVAIAAENDEYDAEIYRLLLERILEKGVTRHPTQRMFSGWRSVRDLAEPYLMDARRKGVRHALLAIDNDGGRDRRLEHEHCHDQATEAANEEDGCRACWLSHVIPPWWSSDDGKHCIVVPVQVLETWLLCVRGNPPFATNPPERDYDRNAIKKRFFGNPLPRVAQRLALALAEVQKSDALTILRQRRSFQHFEAQLTGWV